MTDQITLTQDVFKIDAQTWCQKIQDFIQVTFKTSTQTGIVVPISGGLDSSVVAALCARAIGTVSVTALMLPEWFGNPEANRYGKLLAEDLGIEVVKHNISPVLIGLGTFNPLLSLISGRKIWKKLVNSWMGKRGKSAKIYFGEMLNGILEQPRREMIAGVQAKQRVRALEAYKFADEHNYLVAGSAHKTEAMVGLFVKLGIDDCADLMPLRNIYRSHIVQLAEYLRIPSEIIKRPPNPDILPGVTDKYESYLEMDYHTLDLILYGLDKGLMSWEIAPQVGIDVQRVTEVREIVRLTEGLRNHSLAPVLEY